MQPHPSRLPVSAQPFDKGWTLDDTRQMYEHSLIAPDFSVSPSTSPPGYEQAWRETHHQHRSAMALAIGRHVLHQARTAGLVNAPHTEAVDHRFVNAWRKAVAGEEVSGREAEAIGHAFIRPLTMKLIQSRPHRVTEERPAVSPEEVHAFFQTTVAAGNFESFETEVSGHCATSGHSLLLSMNNWTPSFERFDDGTGRFVPLVDGDVVARTIRHATIPVPSGKLLIADWFRHKAFTQETEKVLEGTPSINSAAGCEEQTRRLASELGVASVIVGNTCPRVVADETGVRVGTLDEDGIGDEAVAGMVCTDLWWTTMVDREVLVGILARSMPREQAVHEVDELVRNQASTIIEVDLPPGEYHLYYTGDHEQFEQLFDRDGVDLSGFSEPMLVLSRHELAPRPQAGTTRPKP